MAAKLAYWPGSQKEAPLWSACEASGQDSSAAVVAAQPIHRTFASNDPIANPARYLQTVAPLKKAAYGWRGIKLRRAAGWDAARDCADHVSTPGWSKALTYPDNVGVVAFLHAAEHS